MNEKTSDIDSKTKNMTLSNLTKSIIVIVGFLIYYLTTHFALIPAEDGTCSVFGALTSLIVSPDNELWYTIIKKVIPCIIPAVIIFFITKKRNIFEPWGLSCGFVKGLLFAIVCTLPMLICNSLNGALNTTLVRLILGAILPGLVEEVFYRGFLFGLLHKYCNWKFIWAALPTAILFTVGHFYQANDLLSAIQVFLVTAAGSFFFSWLYTRWQTLWAPIFMHILMNGIWISFDVEGLSNSVGTITTNVGRVLTLALAIGISIWWSRKKDQVK